MDPNFAETLQMLIGLTGMTVVAVAAMRVWIRKKELDRHADPQLDDLAENLRLDMEDLRAEHAQQISELQERVEFAERLLTKGRDG